MDAMGDEGKTGYPGSGATFRHKQQCWKASIAILRQETWPPVSTTAKTGMAALETGI